MPRVLPDRPALGRGGRSSSKSTEGELHVRRLRFIAILFLVSLACIAPASAQEGHPLKGSWIGTWGPSKLHSNDLLIVLNWDGKAITGTVNPGEGEMAIKNATLNPTGWLVHLEADGKDAAGAAVNYVLDGKIENLAFRNRTITGTWKAKGENGNFKLARQ
jgi:hypothetical protein